MRDCRKPRPPAGWACIANRSAVGRGRPRPRAKRLCSEPAGLLQGPEAHGYATTLWTIGRVGALIEQQTGCQYHPGHVWRLLRSFGWSSQRPTGRAMERDEKAIAHWRKQEWPRIKKKP